MATLTAIDSLFDFFLKHESASTSVILLITIAIFLISWLAEPRRLINGVFFTFVLAAFGFWLAVILFSFHDPLINKIFEDVIIAIILIITLLVVFSWVFFLWNAYFVWKYESHTLPNMLTLLIGLFLIVVWLVSMIRFRQFTPTWLRTLFSGLSLVFLYLGIIMYNFLVNLMLYQFIPRRYHQDYLIVLGAGLIDGDRVSRLLGARIDRAIRFSKKQEAKGRQRPKLIMSGGQGRNEKISEALAMALYTEEKGIPEDQILLEDHSVNTKQNMAFSKEVALRDHHGEPFHAAFFTNNYHTFRAALYAKRAGLNANGIGAKTRFYFLPNAIIREFAGTVVMAKKRHFTIMGLITGFFVAFALFELFNGG